jgi:xylulokinase
MDRSGNALMPAILYCDRRSGKEAADLLECVGGAQAFADLTGNRLAPGTCSVTSLAWVREHCPGVYAEAACFGHLSTLVLHWLTGEWVLDPSDAGLSGLVELASPLEYSGCLCEAFAVPEERLPPIRPSDSPAGRVTVEGGLWSGFEPGTPVCVGGGDAPCAMVGGGVPADGRTLFYVAGSTDCLIQRRTRPVANPVCANLGHCVRGEWLSIGTLTSSGASADWFASSFLGGNATVADVERLAFDHRRDAQAPHFLPYLQGERTPVWDAAARGAFTGLDLHYGLGDLAFAVLEGVACGLRQAVESMLGEGTAPQLLAVGGGTRNLRWLGLKAAVLGQPIAVMAFQECGILGAALLAGLAVGVFPGYEEALAASAGLRTCSFVEPDPVFAVSAGERYAYYQSMYPALRYLRERA